MWHLRVPSSGFLHRCSSRVIAGYASCTLNAWTVHARGKSSVRVRYLLQASCMHGQDCIHC